MSSSSKQIAIVGGGPAGLMAAHHLIGRGFDVHLFDAMPSLGRKFLMAGKSGMNLTHSEDLDIFLSRYGAAYEKLEHSVTDFGPDQIRQWADDLGVETFIGSSGRVFPTDFKAAPLLRSWLRLLRQGGLTIHVRHRWTGWTETGALMFDTPSGPFEFKPAACLFALGGISWPKLGSDGTWIPAFKRADINLAPFKASNCGFHVPWSDGFKEKFAGEPVKPVALKVQAQSVKGEFVITPFGVEGSAIYTQSAHLRDQLECDGQAILHLDLTPDRSIENLLNALNKPQGSKSISTHIKRTIGLSGVKAGLLRECFSKDIYSDMTRLATSIKDTPLKITAMRPIEEAISSAGGVTFDQLDENLMIKQTPGIFLAGEMLDWDAPTGGYLLTACFALGRQAGLGIANWIEATS
jgi:uncharacterized flavoprotein (TIGR03862 family)